MKCTGFIHISMNKSVVINIENDLLVAFNSQKWWIIQNTCNSGQVSVQIVLSNSVND